MPLIVNPCCIDLQHSVASVSWRADHMAYLSHISRHLIAKPAKDGGELCRRVNRWSKRRNQKEEIGHVEQAITCRFVVEVKDNHKAGVKILLLKVQATGSGR